MISPSVAAHGSMRGGEPAPNARLSVPPTEVVVVMSEPILLASSEVHLLDREGRDHGTGAAYFKDGDRTRLARAVNVTANGTYVVVWSALWVSDGHLTHGGYGFVLGNGTFTAPHIPAGTEGPRAEETAARALGYATLTLALGPAALAALAWGPVERFPIPRRLARLTAAAAGAGAVVALGALVVGAATAGLPVAEYAATRLGLLALGRGALLAGAAGLAVALPARLPLTLAPLSAAGFTFSATSHAWASDQGPIIAADFLHVLAAATWVGGLAALLLALPLARERGRLALRFSTMALAAVAVAVLSGMALSATFLGAPDRVLTTAYGRILLVKVTLVAGMLGLGALNRFILVPAVAGTAPPWPLRRAPRLPGDSAPVFRRVVAVETAAGLVVLALAGLLSGTPFEEPPTPAGAFDATALSENGKTRREDGMLIRLTVDPAAVGLNTANATLTHAAGGGAVETAKRVQLFLNKLEEDGRRNASVPVQAVDLDDHGAGRFTGNVTFGLPGLWKVTVAVQRTDAFDDAAAFEVRIR